MSYVVTLYKNVSETVHFTSELENVSLYDNFFIQTAFSVMSKLPTPVQPTIHFLSL